MSKPSPVKPKVRFQRTSILVADLPRALTFWQDVLGFEQVFTKTSDEESYSYDVFDISRDVEITFCVLGTPEQRNVIALTEVPGMPPSTERPRRVAAVVECRDFDAVVSQSKALGLKVYDEDHLVTKDGRQGREAGIVDFDGNLIAVYLITEAAP